MDSLPPTRFTRLLGCRLPIQQAGMGGVSTPAVAAAVAGVGGVGMIGAAGLPAGAVAATLAEVAAIAAAENMAGAGGAVVGVNFLMPFLDLGAFEAAAAAAALVECFYGPPEPDLVSRAHRIGTRCGWQVGSTAEALQARDAGCDLIVVQGIEAGGHVRGRTPLLPLLDEVRAAVELPLVAAGGIGTGRDLAAVLNAGADAARIGTILLATEEADVHPDYARALIDAGARDTVLTEAFSQGWPGAPHRVVRACVEASDADPSQRSPLPPTRDFTGDVAAAALYAGTSVTSVRAVEPAAAIVRRLAAEAAGALEPDAAGPVRPRMRPGAPR